MIYLISSQEELMLVSEIAKTGPFPSLQVPILCKRNLANLTSQGSRSRETASQGAP